MQFIALLTPALDTTFHNIIYCMLFFSILLLLLTGRMAMSTPVPIDGRFDFIMHSTEMPYKADRWEKRNRAEISNKFSHESTYSVSTVSPLKAYLPSVSTGLAMRVYGRIPASSVAHTHRNGNGTKAQHYTQNRQRGKAVNSQCSGIFK